ncbi:MAG TPA: M20/M25/M40 family metallo-hydrolase [Candidatus Saccharimonadales bacterium]|nr:M20/M25/M40 family metallo-hydrolase [Candidatus Saccharimonadales bacterium]
MTALSSSGASSSGASSSAARTPSSSLPDETWQRAHEQLVETLQGLIRIRSVNPPGDEILAARYVEQVLVDAGLRPEVVEPYPGRGSVACRVRGDGTGGEPLLLLSHLDVVPAPPELWTHDPFGGDLADGYVWGRGAVDMKGMVALEIAVLRQLADEARAAGRNPAADAIPGLTRDVLFASTADEEAGGVHGAGWVVAHRPEWLRASGAVNEAGGVSIELAGRRFYPIQVAEKGFIRYRITVRGTWGHGSMPREDNAAVRAADVVSRLAPFEPPRLTPVMERLFEIAAAELPPDSARLLRAVASADERVSNAALEQLCEPSLRRAARALLRDTMSPNMIHSGIKFNVIPGTGEVEVDVRNLPGTPEPRMRERIRARLGEHLWNNVTVEPLHVGEPVEAAIDTELFELLVATLKAHDPDGIPLPTMAPFATDAKHTVKLGVPTYGFSPLRLQPEDRFLELFHGVDERVSAEGLRFGLPVLYDVVRTYCGARAG